MTVQRTDPTMITDVKITAIPNGGQTVSGYGPRLPTRYMVRYGIRRPQWLRVRMMQYGNAGSPYVTYRGQDLFLDIATEYRLSALDASSQTGRVSGL